MKRHGIVVMLAMLLCVRPAPAGAQTATATPTADGKTPVAQSASWRGAIVPSIRMLMLEHVVRIGVQAKTRDELGGDFIVDYMRSLHMPRQWRDGDGWAVNDLGHPMQGAAAGFIWLSKGGDADRQPALFSKEYWATRGRATAWAAGYSFQFEVGPFSEASIGNVGMHPGTIGFTDYVMTPAGGLAFMVAEDAADHYVVMRIESWTGNPLIRALCRMALNPSRSMAVVAQGQFPWYRPGRPLRRSP
jgi:hypothetical protein